MEYERPVVLDYEDGGDVTTQGVIVLPLIVVAVYSVLAGAVAGAIAVVPAVVTYPYPGYD